jgi:hypothetical protein
MWVLDNEPRDNTWSNGKARARNTTRGSLWQTLPIARMQFNGTGKKLERVSAPPSHVEDGARAKRDELRCTGVTKGPLGHND